MQKLVDRYGCMSCHGLVHKQVGPGFAQIADRYRREPGADATLAGRLRSGTVGRWGRLVMPRQAHMTEAESLALSRWVLARP
ncbi:c-type cytochrome [Xylophilus sp. Kf1]|nr:c-type cytochrome [Xylophilus sp. Kf1]